MTSPCGKPPSQASRPGRARGERCAPGKARGCTGGRTLAATAPVCPVLGTQTPKSLVGLWARDFPSGTLPVCSQGAGGWTASEPPCPRGPRCWRRVHPLTFPVTTVPLAQSRGEGVLAPASGPGLGGSGGDVSLSPASACSMCWDLDSRGSPELFTLEHNVCSHKAQRF